MAAHPPLIYWRVGQSLRISPFRPAMATGQTDILSDEPKPNRDDQAKPTREKRGVPGGLWLSCEDCGETIFRKEAERLFNVCPECGYHMYLSARDRIRRVLDEGTFEEWDAELSPTDPLGFDDKKTYAERIKAEQAAHRPARRRAHGHGHDSRPPRGLRRHRFGVHHGQHGFGRRREAHPPDRAGDRAAACR